MKWRYSMHLYASYGELWLARGNFTKAREYAERCLEIANRTNSRKYLVKGWRLEGDIAVALRQWDESEARLRKALSIALAIGNPTQIWKTHLAMGHHYAETKRQEEARQSYQAAREVIDRLKAGVKNPGLCASLENSPLLRQVYGLSESKGPDLGIDEEG
jgi:tetratricopeptide (TPR) repeat protein